MHLMPPDGFLDAHLDADVHPKTGMRRAVNAILFLDHWDTQWGGALCLQRDATQIDVEIFPARNRLVVFECNDASYHAVSQINSRHRRSLASFWWEWGEWECKRPRSLFVGAPDPEKDKWRQERCQGSQ